MVREGEDVAKFKSRNNLDSPLLCVRGCGSSEMMALVEYLRLLDSFESPSRQRRCSSVSMELVLIVESAGPSHIHILEALSFSKKASSVEKVNIFAQGDYQENHSDVDCCQEFSQARKCTDCTQAEDMQRSHLQRPKFRAIIQSEVHECRESEGRKWYRIQWRCPFAITSSECFVFRHTPAETRMIRLGGPSCQSKAFRAAEKSLFLKGLHPINGTKRRHQPSGLEIDLFLAFALSASSSPLRFFALPPITHCSLATIPRTTPRTILFHSATHS